MSAVPNPSATTLPELCEQLFQYICMVNRVARTPSGEALDFTALRDTVQLAFTRMKERAKDDLRLSGQLKKMELPLVFFVDSMIAESALPLAPQWHKNRLAYEQDELAGDEKFFDLLDETLAEVGPEADERLMVYYTCLGLGFTAATPASLYCAPEDDRHRETSRRFDRPAADRAAHTRAYRAPRHADLVGSPGVSW